MLPSLIKQPSRGPPVLRRIDNGWNIDPATPSPSIFPTPEPYSAQLEAIVRSDEAQALVAGADYTNSIEN